jgi:hypothetical protein
MRAMKSLRLPSFRAFFGPVRPPGRHQHQVGTHRADDSGPKHRGKGTAKSRDHEPKHSREARGYDRDDYTGEHRRGGPARPMGPVIGKRRAKRPVTKGKRQTPADDR